MEREIEARFERVEGIMAKLADASLANTAAISQVVGAVDRLADSHLKLADSHMKLSDAMTRMAEALAETTGKVDAVAHIMDLWIRERGEGGPKQ